MVLGSFGGREVVVLLTAGKLLVELSPLGGRREVLVVLVTGYERRRGDPVDNLGAGKLHPRGAQVVQVAEHLSGAGGEQELPTVGLRPLGEDVPVGGIQFWDDFSLPGRIDLLFGGPDVSV